MSSRRIHAVFIVLFFGFAPSFARAASSSDGGFRFRGGACRSTDAKRVGRSPGFFGPCGELKAQKDNGVVRTGSDWTAISAVSLSAEKSTYERIRMPFSILNASKWISSQLSEVDASDGYWVGSRFENSKVDGGDWRRVNLSGARVRRSKWNGVDLRGARMLSIVILKSEWIECDLRGADLSDAVVLLSRFQGSRIDASTKLPFSREAALALGMVYEP